MFDSKKLEEWLNTKDELADITTFSNYWYFRSENYQATQYEDSPVLVKKSLITEQTSFSEFERGYYKYVYPTNSKEIAVLGLDGLPMCHHYSWVLDKNEMLTKVENWGHKRDKDWASLIEEEFSREFNGTDFIHGYKYRILNEVN